MSSHSSSSPSPRPAPAQHRSGGGFLRSDDFGKFILRLTVGGMMLLHGVNKIQHGVDGLKPLLEAKGLPAFLVYGVYMGEVIAPAMIILGLFARVGGLILAINMLVAVYLAHWAQIGLLDPMSGGWAIEVPAFFGLCGLAIFFMGGGRWSVTGGRGTWN